MIADTAPAGFEAQFQEFVYYAGPIIQLLYWVVMIIAALWAVLLIKRWVDFQTRTHDEAAAPVLEAEKPKREPIQVEEFVE
ncbi:MAG: hypothetical protein CVT69_02055 [Actinobacteria bacterium HGW-Actinobacteria-9]|jgi:hypothetical protein|nr:MAG: hypothetical protein CVT69_02055 [Actinobacteria bacterium HGW-Actinobacteria-9]